MMVILATKLTSKKNSQKKFNAVVTQKKADKMYQDMAGKYPGENRALRNIMNGSLVNQSQDKMNQLNNLTKISSSEMVAGETCEYTNMAGLLNTRICYWKTMHQYPSYIKRPIVLKVTVDLRKASKSNFFGKANETTILFEKNRKLPDSIFSVPANIKINDSRLRF